VSIASSKPLSPQSLRAEFEGCGKLVAPEQAKAKPKRQHKGAQQQAPANLQCVFEEMTGESAAQTPSGNSMVKLTSPREPLIEVSTKRQSPMARKPPEAKEGLNPRAAQAAPEVIVSREGLDFEKLHTFLSNWNKKNNDTLKKDSTLHKAKIIYSSQTPRDKTMPKGFKVEAKVSPRSRPQPGNDTLGRRPNTSNNRSRDTHSKKPDNTMLTSSLHMASTGNISQDCGSSAPARRQAQKYNGHKDAIPIMKHDLGYREPKYIPLQNCMTLPDDFYTHDTRQPSSSGSKKGVYRGVPLLNLQKIKKREVESASARPHHI
jgi:hypothetical protein